MDDDADGMEKQALDLLEQAYEQPSPERLAWLERTCAAAPALLARVRSLLDADSLVGTTLRTGGAGQLFEDEAAPVRAGAYRITGLIGRGGMGAVYTAERDQDDFEHQVAIKVVRAGALKEVLVERFARERQILAQLNHPNIARLYDGGTLDDGAPYLVMELIDGEPITEWTDARRASLDRRLGLFDDVCRAVQHAHQNLVVHRDITPTNVLVTEDGIVKLIDFGIAKPHGSGEATEASADAATESLTHTPGYSAPERAAGAEANTLSDIYSLGRLLDELTAGLSRPRDLQAIIDKATAAAPESRYASSDMLAEDVGNFIQGYPVEARAGGAGYRFGKYLARRRWLVSGSALAAVGLITALIVTLVQYNRAEAALERADARFEQARGLSRSLVFDVYDAFTNVSGTLEPRRDLADLVSGYVDTLAADPQAPDDVLFDTGVLSARLADLYGGIGLANLGDTERSLALLLEAERAFETLLQRNPDDMRALAELMMVKRSLTMQNLIYRLEPETAARYNREILERAPAAANRGGAQARTLLRHFWSARTDRLQILFEQRDFDTALAEVRQWRGELNAEMFERLGGGEEMAAYLAMQEAELLFELDRAGEALEPLAYAQHYRMERLDEEPDNYYNLTQLMVVHSSLSRVQGAVGAQARAVEHAERAVALARDIAARDETDAGGPEGLNSALQRLAGARLMAGDIPGARRAAEEAVALARGLLEQFPGDVYYQRILFTSLVTEAESLAGEGGDGCPPSREAERLYDAISDAGGTTPLLETTYEARLTGLFAAMCT